MESWVVPLTLGLMILLLAAGFPVAFALGSAAVVGAYFGFGGNLAVVGTLIWSKLDDYTMAVIIFFILMGELLAEARLTDELYDSAQRWLSRLPGGVLHTNIVASTIFAACTGLSAASAAALGKIAYKSGTRMGYSIKLNMGSMAAGATLGILIPPSVIMIVYGVMAEVSIGRLYMAGIVPGLFMSSLFISWIALYSWRHPEENPPGEQYTLREKMAGVPRMLPVLGVMVVVLGSIYAGFATPNEAGAVGAFFSLLLGLGYRRLTWRKFGAAIRRTAQITAMVMFILIAATTVSTVMAHSGVSIALINWMKSVGMTWPMFFGAIAVIYIILGSFFDSFSILLLTLPFVYPMVKALGVDGVLFGVMVTILIETGLITPPFGINLYVLDGVVGGGKIAEIVRGVLPFFFIMCFVLVVIFLFPQIALWLPGTMYAK